MKNKFIIVKTLILKARKFFQYSILSLMDFIYLISLNLNYKNNKIAKNKKLIFVTAADESHYKSAEQLINSIIDTNKNSSIIFYDLGINTSFKHNQYATFDLTYKKFPYKDFPNFFSQKVYSVYDNSFKLGNYAWKAAIVKLESHHENKILVWVDAGNIVFKELNMLKKITSKKKFYSPISSNNVKRWTYISLINRLNIPKKILNKKNLSSGLVCFDLTSKLSKKIIENWFLWSKDINLIAPKGSNRSNHRQDQTLLTLLYHLQIGKPIFPKTNRILGIDFHKDIEK